MQYHQIKKLHDRLESLLQVSETLHLQVQRALEELRIAMVQDEKELDQSLDQDSEHA